MNILGIETSCDETSVAVVRDGRHILSNVVASQIPLHQKYGGVVPELASRQHVITIIPVLEEALSKAGCSWDNIDAVAVTRGPGLSPALLVGVNTAKGIAFARQKPLVAVNHIEGHVYSNWLIPEADAAEGRAEPEPRFPALCLIVSGGHTELILMTAHGRYRLLGKTVDDAAGEAFDKAARILGLGYPGGPAIQKAAEGGDPAHFHFPRAQLKGTLDFSFSGVKTALLRKAEEYGVTSAGKPAPWQRTQEQPQAVQAATQAENGAGNGETQHEQEAAERPMRTVPTASALAGKAAHVSSFTSEANEQLEQFRVQPPPRVRAAHAQVSPPPAEPEQAPTPERSIPVADLAASFQAAVVDALISKTLTAAAENGVKEVLVAGGVAANALLRTQLKERLTIPFRYPPLSLCTDNAAMIAAAAYYRYSDSRQYDLSMDIEPNARLM
ncbi:MAG: tRNA (adenosine(37)-N6)-threonylcarbamoyltransferase complex transferase subunit TsaD [Chloroflexia bacterium]